MLPERLDDDYRLCEVYEARLRDSEHPTYANMIAFEHTDGKFYFATTTEDGELHMRSEGYPNEGARAVGMKSVNRFRGKRTRYGVIERGEKYFAVLRAQNGQEILRSCGLGSRAEAEALMPAMSKAALALAEQTAADEAEQAALAAALANEEVDAEDAELGPVRLKRDDDYLVCSKYTERIGDSASERYENVIEFQHDNGKYYFALLDGRGEIGLRSEGYPTPGARTNGLKSVMRNRGKRQRYEVEEERGIFYAVLYAQNGQEIARSCPKKEREAADGLLPAVTAAAAALAASQGVSAVEGGDTTSYAAKAQSKTPAKKREAAPPPEFAEVNQESKIDDDYLPCAEYEARIGDSRDKKNDNVVRFQHPDGRYFFAILNEDGGLFLRSEAYPTTGARDTGQKAVLRNLKKRNRYKVEERDGKYYTILYAQNGQEIGRSCPQASRAAAESMMPAASAASLALAAQAEADAKAAEEKAREEAAAAEAATAAAAAAAAAKAAAPQSGERLQDNYLVCSAYEARLEDSRDPKHADVIQFKHDNGLFYFATVNEDGSLALRSEGYPTEGARATGLKAVLRNRTKRQRFKIEEKRGLHYTVLYAQNGQEIGRSCPKKERAVAEGMMPGLSAASLALAAAATQVETPEPVVEAPAAPPTPVVDRDDDYLACDEYRDRFVNDPKNRVAHFRHENGQHYFVIYDEQGGIRLRSEGFTDKDKRDSELAAAIRLVDKEDHYDRIERGGKYINVLKDESGREVGRSCAESEPVAFVPDVAVAGAGLGAAAIGAAALLGNDELPDPPAEPEPPKEKEDDYLKCKEYAGRKINDKVNRVALFKHKNGQYYFAFYDDDNRVRLRSEGFETAKGRDQELSGALRFQNDEDKWERISVGGRYINVLRDDTGREVGRSCISKDPVPFLLAPAAAGAALAGAAAVAAAAPVVTPAPKPEPVVAAAPPPPKAAPVVADKGGAGWWLWALLGLLALGLLLWLLRGCFGCGDVETVAVAAPEVEAPVAVAPPPPPPVEAAPVAPVEATPPPPTPAPAPAPAPVVATAGAACGPIVANAPESSYGVPLLTGGDYGGLAGDVQDFLAGGESSATYPLRGIEFLSAGNDYAVEPCSIGNVDRLAAVLRNNPAARITVSASTARRCASLKRLLTYRGVDASRIDVQPDGPAEITVRRS